MNTAAAATTVSATRARRAPTAPAAPTGADLGAGQLILRMELSIAIEIALLTLHAQGKGTTSYHGMRAAAQRVFGIG